MVGDDEGKCRGRQLSQRHTCRNDTSSYEYAGVLLLLLFALLLLHWMCNLLLLLLLCLWFSFSVVVVFVADVDDAPGDYSADRGADERRQRWTCFAVHIRGENCFSAKANSTNNNNNNDKNIS